MFVFALHPHSEGWKEELSMLSEKELAYIEDYAIEGILAQTNRRYFTKMFTRTLIPQISLISTFSKK